MLHYFQFETLKHNIYIERLEKKLILNNLPNSVDLVAMSVENTHIKIYN